MSASTLVVDVTVDTRRLRASLAASLRELADEIEAGPAGDEFRWVPPPERPPEPETTS